MTLGHLDSMDPPTNFDPVVWVHVGTTLDPSPDRRVGFREGWG